MRCIWESGCSWPAPRSRPRSRPRRLPRRPAMPNTAGNSSSRRCGATRARVRRPTGSPRLVPMGRPQDAFVAYVRKPSGRGMPSFAATPERDLGTLRVHPVDCRRGTGRRQPAAAQGDRRAAHKSQLMGTVNRTSGWWCSPCAPPSRGGAGREGLHAAKTAWGDPDLQGVWPSTDMVSVPFERRSSSAPAGPHGRGIPATAERRREAGRAGQRVFQRRQRQAGGRRAGRCGCATSPPPFSLERGVPSRQSSLLVDPPTASFRR